MSSLMNEIDISRHNLRQLSEEVNRTRYIAGRLNGFDISPSEGSDISTPEVLPLLVEFNDINHAIAEQISQLSKQIARIAEAVEGEVAKSIDPATHRERAGAVTC